MLTDRYSELQQNYGNSISEMAARQSVDAMFNQDLMRLQILLKDLVKQPDVILATIHDIENNLMVQAGETRFTEPVSIYSQPILLHDSIAGHLSVTIANRSVMQTFSVIVVTGLGILLLGISIWSLVASGAIEFQESPADITHDIATDTASSTEEATEKLSKVFAVIHIKNLDVLTQQLSGPHYRSMLERMEKLIADVLVLYSGEHFIRKDNYYILSFSEYDSKGEALFRATCSAHLLLELGGILNNIPMDLAALISADEADIVPSKLPISGLITDATTSEDTHIAQRIQFMDVGTDDDRKVVAGFSQPFDTLLENQRKQLSQLI